MHVMVSEAYMLWYNVLARYKSAMLEINTAVAITGRCVPLPEALYRIGTAPATERRIPIRCVIALPGSFRKLLCTGGSSSVITDPCVETEIVPSALVYIDGAATQAWSGICFFCLFTGFEIAVI